MVLEFVVGLTVAVGVGEAEELGLAVTMGSDAAREATLALTNFSKVVTWLAKTEIESTS